jgi:hypothetical protein
VSVPCVLGRLGHLSSTENETFFAKNEVPLFHSSEQDLVFDINDLDLLTASHLEDDSFDQDVPPFDLAEFEHKALPFDLMSPDEVVVFDEDNAFNDSNIAMTARHGRRKLQSSAMQVTIRNDCSLQPFLLAIIYYSTSEGRVVHKGWYNLKQGHRVTFTDVGQRKYALYAMSEDGRFIWDGDATSQYCPNNRCYKDFSVGGTSNNHFRYLYCSSGGGGSPAPAPTPPVPSPSVSGRAALWVQAHNTRRQRLHSELGKSFKPLQWSNKLAVSAQGYADKLLNLPACNIQHGYQGDSYGGENIASNWGNSVSSFESPDAVLTRWFEEEANLPWPQNGHYTQVGWRGTSYVGCGEARKLYDGRNYCKIQVCRYLAPGNCNVGSKALRSLMADDYTPCGPQS